MAETGLLSAAAPARRRGRALRDHRWWSPWLLIAPALIWLVVWSLAQAVQAVALSFTNVQVLGGGGFVGFRNYEQILTDQQFWNSLLNSVIYAAICVPFLTVLPLLIALLVKDQIPGVGIFRTVFYLPVVASIVAAAVIWQYLFNDRGLINQILGVFAPDGKPVAFLEDRWLLLFTAISLTIWKGLGYYMVLYVSALANVRGELHAAAAVDGAGAFRRFLNVTLPGVRPTMFLVAALVATSAMRVFTELYQLAGAAGGVGGYDMSVVFMIENAVSGVSGNVGYAAALSVLLFFCTLGPLTLVAIANRRANQ
jgi:multiple sugar transport system permease protein